MTNSSKEVLFLNELEEILEITHIDQFRAVQKGLFERLCRCVSSNHFQVAERSLFLLNNEHLMKMISENKETLFPILIKGLLKNSKHHWNQ